MAKLEAVLHPRSPCMSCMSWSGQWTAIVASSLLSSFISLNMPRIPEPIGISPRSHCLCPFLYRAGLFSPLREPPIPQPTQCPTLTSAFLASVRDRSCPERLLPGNLSQLVGEAHSCGQSFMWPQCPLILGSMNEVENE